MTMLPRLDAEEKMAAINVQALATGNMQKHDARRMKEKLERAARGGVRVRPAKASPAMLAAMGITVVPALPAPEKAAGHG